eukprot:scaffold421301_cov52-Attheya_sp.AAC.13
MAGGGAWSLEEDFRLWNSRSKPASSLATEYNRSVGGIRSRLKHLQDPTHKAYRRLFSITDTHLSGGKKVEVICLDDESEDDCKALDARVTSSNPTPPNRSSPPPNAEQKSAADLILSGTNVFLTGAAGVGKSFLLRYVISSLKARVGENGVGVTASTGIAATHIEGVTLHSWAGIGLGKGGPAKLLPKVLENKAACNRWRTTKTLVIDEVSMIDGFLFQALDDIGRTVRGSHHLPFGGLQLVLCGDFFQLPPVSLAYAGFAFQAPAWVNGDITTLELTTIVRQEGNSDFIHALRQLRLGHCPTEVAQLLATCHISRKPLPTDDIVPTKLYCTNKNVDAENITKLQKLNGHQHTFESKDSFKGNYSSSVERTLLQQIDKKSPSVIGLKIGAQVMLLKNTPEWNLVNGSRGVVVGFDNENSGYPNVQFANGKVHTITPFNFFAANGGGAITRSQLPLKLAWCWTVHKSQGMTLDRAELQLDDAFDYGQAYVALSRVKSLDGLWIRGSNIGQSIVKAHPAVLEFHTKSGGK